MGQHHHLPGALETACRRSLGVQQLGARLLQSALCQRSLSTTHILHRQEIWIHPSSRLGVPAHCQDVSSGAGKATQEGRSKREEGGDSESRILWSSPLQLVQSPQRAKGNWR